MGILTNRGDGWEIEVLLASSREERRAVVSQILVNAVQKLQKRCNVVPPQPDDDPPRLVELLPQTGGKALPLLPHRVSHDLLTPLSKL